MNSPTTNSLFKHYKLDKPLLQNDNYEVYLGERLADHKPVILKQTGYQNGDLSRVSKLGNEYDIMKDLDHPGIPKVYDFSFDGSTAVLAEEFVDGKNLKQLIFESKLTYREVIDLALKLAEIIHYLHEHSVIHKDISPGNILISKTGDLKLIDFGISNNLYSETNELLNLDKIEGTLNYISPEQTGRTVYSVTQSCDFYSTGILLYELLAGKLPFDSVDSLEIIHFHLSRKPMPLKSVCPDLPNGLEQVVFKLLEKNPDDRYQNASGLISDLKLIRDSILSGKALPDFKAGSNDVVLKYKQTQKLYGRGAEIDSLMGYYDNLHSVKSMLALVSGYSGVGKSALIKQVKLPIIQNRGTFISGKFDQLKKDIPYYAFIEAIKDFIKNLLSESEDTIDAWKHRITGVLGDNAGLITDVIPQLSLIIGNQPAVAKLQPAEQESRFNMVLLDFIYAFSTSESPLVIFLDDLQWADLSSLNLMKRILENPRDESIMLIGSYRDNEIHQGHPLMITLKQIRESDGFVKSIHLEPLNLETTIQITADSFGMTPDKAHELGVHVFSKTKGNPFFIHSFLKSLFDKGLIVYGADTNWVWDQAEIEELEYSANVIDLMTKGLTGLPGRTQKILQYASVLGNTFSINDLYSITDLREIDVYDSLKPAIKEGYINSRDLSYRSLTLKSSPENSPAGQEIPTRIVKFSFSHDKVQQAAYNLIPEVERPSVHLKTGRLLLLNRDKSQIVDDIFEVMNHFVYSSDFIKEAAEKLEITELCLIAGKKAKDSNSYSLGVRYLEMGKELLGKNSWEDHYELTYNVFIELGECEYLYDHPEKAESYFEELLVYSKTNFEKLKVYYIHSSLYLKIGNSSKSLSLGLEAARLYDIHFPENARAIQLKTAAELGKYLVLFSTKYRKRENLFHLKECRDEEIIVLNKFLIDLATSAYQQDQNLMMLVVFKIIELYIRHGFTNASGWGFSGFSVVVLSALKLQKKGFDLWDITLKLHQRTKSPLIKARLTYTVYAFHDHWRKPIQDSYSKILDLTKACVLNGDQIFTSYAVALHIRSKINGGENLNEVLDSCSDHIPLIKNSKGGYDFFECFYQAAKALNGQTYQNSWDDENFDSIETQKRLEKEGNRTKLGFFHSAKCNFLYINGDYTQALKESEKVRSYADNFVGDQQQVSFAFYTSLSIASIYETFSQRDKRKQFRVFKRHLADLKQWANGSPENYSQHYHLLKAELYAMQGKFRKAQHAYENSIELAAENGFTQVQAIANERAAELCAKSELNKQRQFYMEEAWSAYYKWGAYAKCEKLEKAYPYLMFGRSNQERLARVGESTVSASNTVELDLASVIKATQNIASQTKYDDLLNNLLQITIENAGAERGCLILFKEKRLCIEAIGVSGSDIIEILPSIPLEEMRLMPESVINYCWRTKESVVLHNAQIDERFGADPYIQEQNLFSVMCLPISAVGKDIGLLYLENSLIKGVFDKNRIELLEMLSGQIGISIDNANLISNLEDKVRERTSEIEKAYSNLQQVHEDLKAAQVQLVQQEKLASLGQLTAGIAHEIKNPLNFVNNFSELSIELLKEIREEILSEKVKVKSEKENPLLRGEGGSEAGARGVSDGAKGEADRLSDTDLILDILDDIETNLKTIHKHGSRADSIVKSMLDHSRGGTGAMEPNNLNALVKEYVNLSFHGMRASKNPINVDIDLKLDDKVGDIPLIAEDFSRVIVNLCNNAFDAMREKAKVKSEKGEEFLPVLSVKTSRNGKSVEVQIADNGPGIPVDLKDKVLQPFFTTKKGTEGTGLGLSITNDIIKAHGGVMTIESDTKGSTFKIHLPR